jgi:hypothetical protein
MYRVEVFKPTQDDWHGSYRLDDWYNGTKNQMLVNVIFNGNIRSYDPKETPVWRTCVWGNDDDGMEYDCDNETEAWTMFLQVIGMKFVNKDDLKKLGYVPA